VGEAGDVYFAKARLLRFNGTFSKKSLQKVLLSFW